MYEASDLKVEAMRAANQAVGTARSYNQNPQPIAAGVVLEEAKRIYAWFTEGEKDAPAT